MWTVLFTAAMALSLGLCVAALVLQGDDKAFDEPESSPHGAKHD